MDKNKTRQGALERVRRVIARINNTKNAWLFTPEMGVDVAINQPGQDDPAPGILDRSLADPRGDRKAGTHGDDPPIQDQDVRHPPVFRIEDVPPAYQRPAHIHLSAMRLRFHTDKNRFFRRHFVAEICVICVICG